MLHLSDLGGLSKSNERAREKVCASRKERREQRKTGKMAENEIGKIIADTAVPTVGKAG